MLIAHWPDKSFQEFSLQKRLLTKAEMGFSTFPCRQDFISPIFFLSDLRPSFIADLFEQSQFERLGNDLFMNIRTNDAVPNGIQLCCVEGPVKGVKLVPHDSKTIEKLEKATLIGLSDYLRHSEFLLHLPMRADEYYR